MSYPARAEGLGKYDKYKPALFVQNETHPIFLNFEIQTYNVMPARKPDLVLIKKKKNE